jgi:hypothetical protein
MLQPPVELFQGMRENPLICPPAWLTKGGRIMEKHPEKNSFFLKNRACPENLLYLIGGWIIMRRSRWSSTPMRR